MQMKHIDLLPLHLRQNTQRTEDRAAEQSKSLEVVWIVVMLILVKSWAIKIWIISYEEYS
jgi:hypothetical protein